MNDNPWKAMGLVGAVGVDLAVCMWAGYFAGSVLDNKMGTSMMWALIGLGIGLVVGVLTVIALIKRVTGEDKSK
jgi:membrane protein DedA with SNARE-associated domain